MELKCPVDLNCGLLAQCINNTCQHDPIFPLSIYTSLVYLLCPILVGIGMVGGLGGGVLKGPIFIMMLNYETSYATFISYCIMFGGCFFNTFFIMRKTNPLDLSRPLINFDIAMIFNCAISLGTILGSVLNVFLPKIFAIMIQEIFLLCLIPLLVKQGMQERKKKTSVQVQLLESEAAVQNRYTDSMLIDQMAVDIVKEYSDYFPKKKLGFIFLFFMVSEVVMVTGRLIAKHHELPKCLDINFILLPILIIINIPMTLFVYRYGKKEDQIKDIYQLYTEERFFNFKSFIFIYFGGLGAGLASGLIGLGAGLIMIPVMLQLGLHPRVASGTSGLNYLFISLTSMTKVLDEELLSTYEILWFTSLAMIGGCVICKLGYYYVEKYKLAFFLILIVISLALLNLIAGIYFPIIESKRFGFDSMLDFGMTC